MGFKTHLQACVCVVGLFSAFGALAQDSDGDKVADNAPDHCPNTPGVAANYGCPADLEVVVAYGWWWNEESEDWSDWFTDYVICPDGHLYASEDGCPTYGRWGDFVISYWYGGAHQGTEQKHDGARSHCGYVENPASEDCFCNGDEVKAEVTAGSFCRPTCPAGQRWADGLAYGAIYDNGGTCARNSCVNTWANGHTRLDARPSISCFPDMHKEYVDDFVMPTACHFLVGAGAGVACTLAAGSSLTGIGLGVFAAFCSGSASVVSAVIDMCPDYPDYPYW